MTLPSLADIVALLTIASLLSAAFNYVVIRPLREAIYKNSHVLDELRRSIDESARDRRNLDTRLSALEGEFELHRERLSRMEETCRALRTKS